VSYRVPPKLDFSWLISLFLLAGIVGFSALLVWGAGATKCSFLGDEIGHPTKYRFFTGCYVEVDGKWIPQTAWRVTPSTPP